MPEDIAKFLKEELHRTTDFVDCIWEVLSGDSRCRRELIRKIESTPNVAIPLSPVATPASIAEDDPDIRDVTVDPVTPAPNTDQLIARSWSSARGYNEAAADTEAENIVQRKRCLSKDDIKDSRTVKKRSPPLPPTATASKPRQISTQASTVETSRRFRGPGRKQKPSAPDFNDERFNNILEQLRREIAEYTLANGLQDAWRVVDALRWPNPEAVKLDESISRIRHLQCQIQRCDIPDAKDNSLPTLLTIQQRFYMVQLMAEYQKALEEKHKGDKFGALKWFQREVYPDQNSKQRQKSWDYFRRTAEPLFEAVRRYGYGVLIFPLRNVTMKSLHCLRRESISDVLDYIQNGAADSWTNSKPLIKIAGGEGTVPYEKLDRDQDCSRSLTRSMFMWLRDADGYPVAEQAIREHVWIADESSSDEESDILEEGEGGSNVGKNVGPWLAKGTTTRSYTL
ncbi:uncharacterized protein BBA_09060 [Beauveria bassiana ARSEF 2860]|uniref:Uncharacterized protein n=1 Tax=Beauveria bassiana (strain ARSEF 2860) TaxID=655819 RepID=J4UGK0_BEAB2|nr:uncharacterized protein BBA_09060 [Beauveria bassiana ARSEF 2860]EJP62012.1 hypothetical protein BBA_09060 [Beauveria bassiana ARSEF 2860]